MKIIGNRVMLRDYQRSDFNDHLKWRTIETEWMNWDSPWREDDRIDAYEYSERRLAVLGNLSDENIRWTFEICTYPEERHIGWSNCYCLNMFYNYSKKPTGRYALGIDIVPEEFRGKGLGSEAFRLFQNYLLEFGITRVYTQTWVGNTKMQKMAESLGYQPCNLKRNKFSKNNKKYDIITYYLDLE